MVFKSIIGATCTCLAVVSFNSNAATITLSDLYYRSWNGIIEHQEGAGTSNSIVSTGQTDSIGPVIVSNNTSYASAYGSSDYLSLSASSSVDGSDIGLLGLDYAIAEATTWFEADLVVSGGTGNALLNIDAFYNETLTSNPTAFLHGEQRIRIFDATNDLVLAYLRGVSNENELIDILLDFDATYRLQMTSTAYTKVDAGYFASSQRDFSATISAVSAVPVPAAVWLFGSGLIGLIGLARRKR